MRNKLQGHKGQASLIMILLIAMAFIFFAIELNWGKVANWKLGTWMAATSAASQVASNFASYGERVLQEELLGADPCDGAGISYDGGNIKCEQDSLGWFLDVLVIIIVVIIIIVTWGTTAWLLAVVVAVLMIVAMVLQYCVIQPMMFSMWNKLQQNLTTSNQFQESGLSTGLQMLATDSAMLPDRFDWDGNGRWGFQNPTTLNDKISRYALYYTERLKFIKPKDTSAYDAFQTALDNLINGTYSSTTSVASGLGFDPYCSGDRSSLAPQCYGQCTGVGNRAPASTTSNVGLGNSYNVYYPGQTTQAKNVPYVPAGCGTCSSSSIPTTCPSLASGDSRPLLYDPSLELPPNPIPPDPGDPTKSSFRTRLGHDDEVGKSLTVNATTKAFDTTNAAITSAAFQEPGYVSSKARGIVFPMFYSLGTITQSTGFRMVTGSTTTVNTALSTVAQGMTTLKPRTDSMAACNDSTDTSTACAGTFYNFWDTNNFDCAQTADSKNGFFWKKGADQFCSDVEDNNAYTIDRNALISKGVTGWSGKKHWPYYDCTYMHDSSGNPKGCSSASGNLWPQDRVDDFVYKLSDLIKLDLNLSKLQGVTLTSSANQWYKQAASYIAPQCSTSACQQYISQCQQACRGDSGCMNSCQCYSTSYNPPSTPIDTFVATDASMATIYPYANDPNACNTGGKQGAMIQWVYDLANWADKLSNTNNTGWLNKTYGTATTDLCPPGKISSIVTCLKNNTKYVNELDACKKVFPASFVAGTPLPADCATVVHLEKIDETLPAASKAFFTHFSNYSATAVPDVAAASPVVACTVGSPASFFCPVDSICIGTANPGSCSAPYVPTNATFTIIQKWLSDNTLLKDGVNQRYNFVNNLSMDANGSYNLFKEGHDDFLNFLNGPAKDLMDYHASTAISGMTRLPRFAIYGWKDNKTYTASGTKRTGMWHLARMEVASYRQVPWINSWQDVGFITTKTYYQFTDGNHDVVARATRWDENKTGGIANFANQMPIWRFVWGNPTGGAGYTPITWNGESSDPTNASDVNDGISLASSNAAQALEQYCIGGSAATSSNPWGLGIGLTDYTIQSLNRTYSSGSGRVNLYSMNNGNVPDYLERDVYGYNDPVVGQGGAFMINVDPRVKIPAPQRYTGSCAAKSPTSYTDPNLTNCRDDSTFWNCCNTGTYSYGVHGYGYLGGDGVTYCQTTNKAKCAQNIRSQELYRMQKTELKCFSAVDYLLSTGVQSTSAARYGVPPLGAIGGSAPTFNQGAPYHTQIWFYTPQEAENGVTADGKHQIEYHFDKYHTVLDTNIFD